MEVLSRPLRRQRLQRSFHRFRLTQKILFIILGLFAIGLVFSFILVAWYARDLPAPGKLSQVVGSSTVFYDRDGKVLFDMYKDKNRVPVSLGDISKDMQEATISIEDKDFYHHSGISPTGIIRSVINIILHREIEGGGSTITQQLIKNILLGPQQTASRKLKEIILAVLVEKKYTKDQILEMYLNEAPYGGSFWGIGSAARGYFNKQPKDLDLLESAILAGLPQRPNFYSPFLGEKDAWRGRAEDVLRRMREDGYITRAQEQQTDKQLETYKFSSPNISIDAPHFVFYVRDQIEKEFGPKILDQGVRVKTTLSLDVQREVQKIVTDEVKKLKSINVGNGAAVVLDTKTGQILAMVGSYDFNDPKYGNFNAATGLRQPGSGLKPITYGLGLERGYTAATLLMDLQTDFPDQGGKTYTPVNYDGKFKGPVQMRFTLGNSINVPAVKMLAMVGIKDFLTRADAMGLHTLAPTQDNLNRFGLALTLGGGEVKLVDLTSAYSVFARGGTQIDSHSILEITDANGKVLYRPSTETPKRIFNQEVSFIISHILSDNVARTMEFGPNSYLRIPGKTVAVKTGTTNDKRDNWTIGYTNDITAGVWVGNNDNTPMNQEIASGITGASPIWYDIMSQLLKKKYKDGIMDKPADVKALTIDAFLGGLPKDGYPTRSEYFIDGTEPKDTSPFYKKVKISKANGKLANDIEIKNGNFDEKDRICITENDPVSTDGKNRWQDAINAWANSQSDEKYHCPTETSDASADDVIVSIKQPGDHSTNSSNLEVKAHMTTNNPIKRVEIKVNGNTVKTIDGDNRDIDETINLSDGTYNLQVVATNDKDKQGQANVNIGINKPWDSGTPTPSPTPATH